VDKVRVVNFIMQAIYLPVHMAFIISLIKRRMATPIWKWFIVLVTGLWGIVCGRFLETCLYLFYMDNELYAFEVDFQLLSTTIATMSYLMWNLFLAGKYKLAENKIFRFGLFSISFIICLVFCSNPLHHLFYEQLILGEAVIHGKLFIPCLLIVYGMLLTGLVISIIFVVNNGTNKVKRILVFSMYPLLPGVANLVRSLSGVDEYDLNPIIMSVSIWCLYLIVFKDQYVNIIPESMENVLNQTDSAIFVFDKDTGIIIYQNASATTFSGSIENMTSDIYKVKDGETKDMLIDKRYIRISKDNLADSDEQLVMITDISEIHYKQEALNAQIEQQQQFLSELEDKKRNIEAYLDSLYLMPNLKEKQLLIQNVQKDILEAFKKIEENLNYLKTLPDDSEKILAKNMVIASDTLVVLRDAVARLKEA